MHCCVALLACFLLVALREAAEVAIFCALCTCLFFSACIVNVQSDRDHTKAKLNTERTEITHREREKKKHI